MRDSPTRVCLVYEGRQDRFEEVLGSKQSRILGLDLAVLGSVLLLYASTTHSRVFSAGNDAARWALVEAVVDFHTTDIRVSRFGQTVDRVILGDGRELPNKPPLLSLAAAGIYHGLQSLFGWSLSGAGAGEVVRWTTIILVGVPGAFLAWNMARTLRQLDRSGETWPSFVALAVATGTLLWPFATTLNAHLPAAWLVFASWGALMRNAPAQAGALASTGGALDLLPGFGMLPFLAWAILRRSAQGKRMQAVARFAAGALAGTSLAVASNFWVSGSPLPPKWLPGSRDLSAQMGPSLFGVVLPDRWSYPFEILLGGHGLFFVSPLLLVAALGWVLKIRRAPAEEVRGLWCPLGWGLFAQYAGHAAIAGSYGGWSFGYRYLIPVAPLMVLALAGTFRGLIQKIWWCLFPISFCFAALGAYHPWPPAFEQSTSRHPVAALVTNPVGGNFAAWLAYHAPGSRFEEWVGSWFVSSDRAKRREYYRLFYGSRGDLQAMRRFS